MVDRLPCECSRSFSTEDNSKVSLDAVTPQTPCSSSNARKVLQGEVLGNKPSSLTIQHQPVSMFSSDEAVSHTKPSLVVDGGVLGQSRSEEFSPVCSFSNSSVPQVDAQAKPPILWSVRSGGYQAATHRRLQKNIQKRKRKLWRRK